MLSALPIILAIAAVVYYVAKSFGKKVELEVVIKVVGIALTLGPVLVFYFLAALATYGMLGLFSFWLLYKAASYVLQQIGLLPYIVGWHVWSLIPEWVWVSASMLIGGALIGWLFEGPALPFQSRGRKSLSVPNGATDVAKSSAKKK